MGEFIKEINEYTGLKDKGFRMKDFDTEIEYITLGIKFLIRNREYRDDTNSNDVEEVIIDLLLNKKLDEEKL